MNATQKERTLDNVLFRFHCEVTEPTPMIVAAWLREYPEFAAEIQAHAVEMLDLKSRADAVIPNLESLEAEARSAGLNAVYEANQRDAVVAAANTSLREAAAQVGTSLRDIADSIGIARAVVADVSSGAILPETINAKFYRVVAPLLRQDAGALRNMVVQTKFTIPSGAVAFKASALPNVGKPRTWREAINASDMPPDKKAYWLSDTD